MIYIERIKNDHSYLEDESYPYNIPFIRNIREITFSKEVTFIIGENGSGKSTLMEALAINAGFNPEGGSRNFKFSTRDSHSGLFSDIKLVRSPYRNKDGFFLRAESFYNVATEIDNISYGIHSFYGGRSLHTRSHGEGFLMLIKNRFFGKGLYILDEPETGLSPTSLMAMLVRIQELVRLDSQFIISTHSPILLAFPGSDIINASENGPEHIEYENTNLFRLSKRFLNDHRSVLEKLLGNENTG